MRCQRIKSVTRTVSKHHCERQQDLCLHPPPFQDLVDTNFSHALPEACIPLKGLVNPLHFHPVSIDAYILLRVLWSIPRSLYPPPGSGKPGVLTSSPDRCLYPPPERTVATAIIQADIATAQQTQPKLHLLGVPSRGRDKATTG